MSKIKEFKKELKVLLGKYDAEIGFDASDSNGFYTIYDEHMYIEIGEEITIFENDWSIRESDL
ncbi:MAG: hypothetical protein DRG78_09040 [Epsilonproteobacteria bacterium]|nr:MAG: hypothetical protein DRG78_09040 [Campylobacterota bacterium]